MGDVGTARMRVNVDQLRRLFAKFTGPEVTAAVDALARSKGAQAIISQAIADNFEQEGPGWPPLKAQTIRQSVSKSVRKRLVGYNQVRGSSEPARKILQRNGTLKRAATTPGAPGNVYQVTGRRIEWGVSLIYAGIHNSGGTIKHPGTDNGFGMGIKIKPYSINIPKREYLRLADRYLAELNLYAAGEILTAIRRAAEGGV